YFVLGIRKARIARQKQLGIIPANFEAAEPMPLKMHHKNMENGRS
ncbi:putative arylsulfatase domain protein, partial [Acinetobacter baumannii 6112]